MGQAMTFSQKNLKIINNILESNKEIVASAASQRSENRYNIENKYVEVLGMRSCLSGITYKNKASGKGVLRKVFLKT